MGNAISDFVVLKMNAFTELSEKETNINKEKYVIICNLVWYISKTSPFFCRQLNYINVFFSGLFLICPSST